MKKVILAAMALVSIASFVANSSDKPGDGRHIPASQVLRR